MTINTFNILDHIEKLKPAKEKGRYHCPVCKGHNLTINKDGAYQCWNSCECNEIREAIAPWGERHQEGSSNRVIFKVPKSKQQKSKPAPLPGCLELAKLPAPKTDSPHPQQDFDPQHGQVVKTTYVYSTTAEGHLNQWVVRSEWEDLGKAKGRAKKFTQWHRDTEGRAVPKKGEECWKPYRLDEAIAAVRATQGTPALLIVEGEKCVEALRRIGIAAITLQGSSWGEVDLKGLTDTLKTECPMASVVVLPDNDNTGLIKAVKLRMACDSAAIPYLVIYPTSVYPDLIKCGDVVEILAEMDTSEFIRRLEEEIHQAIEARRQTLPASVGAKKTEKAPPADIVGQEIIEDYRDRFLWNDQYRSWMEYSLERQGVWTPVSDGYLESVVDGVLESKGISGYGTASYVTNILAKMRRRLFARLWAERPTSEILPFTDGVLNLTNGKFDKHSPGNRLTWCLPRPYNAIATGFPSIQGWLDEATSNNQLNQIILTCFMAAGLRGRCDLQKFLHLIGVGGSGKSTLTRLLEALIGSQNCWNGSLQDLEDKHEVARLIGKRLAIMPDQDKVTGSLSNFKRLTGQDSLSGRHLYKDGINFRFPGMAIVTSNAPIFHADGGSWLTRRIIMLAFDHKPAANKVRDLEAEFEPELSAFTNYLLSIPNDEITRVLRGTGKGNVEATLWQSKIRTDSISAWVNERVVHDPLAQTQIGSDRNEWANEAYSPKTSTLFGSYAHYCRISGLQARAKNNFSADLIELVQQTLGWTNVQWARDSQGRRVIRGLRLRTDGDSTPFLEDSLTTDDLTDDLSDDLTDDLKPICSKDSDDPDDLCSTKLCRKNSNGSSEIEQSEIQIDTVGKVSDDLAVSSIETQSEPTSQVVSEVVSGSSVRSSDRSSEDTDANVDASPSSLEGGGRNGNQRIIPNLGDRVVYGDGRMTGEITKVAQGGWIVSLKTGGTVYASRSEFLSGDWRIDQ